MTEHVIQKAIRLFEGGAVTELSPPTERMFDVRGDSDRYLVLVSTNPLVPDTCTCPAVGTCSHLLAAKYAVVENQREEST